MSGMLQSNWPYLFAGLRAALAKIIEHLSGGPGTKSIRYGADAVRARMYRSGANCAKGGRRLALLFPHPVGER